MLHVVSHGAPLSSWPARGIQRAVVLSSREVRMLHEVGQTGPPSTWAAKGLEPEVLSP